jgi:hypothetical protein
VNLAKPWSGRRGGDFIGSKIRDYRSDRLAAFFGDDYIVSSFWQGIDMKPELKMGMVGGGREGTIGVVHQTAAQRDRKIELVAGAFSSDAERSRQAGEDLGLHSSRVYSDYRIMAAEEAKLPAGARIDFVSIVTPNHLHFPVAKAFLEGGSMLSATSR